MGNLLCGDAVLRRRRISPPVRNSRGANRRGAVEQPPKTAGKLRLTSLHRLRVFVDGGAASRLFAEEHSFWGQMSLFYMQKTNTETKNILRIHEYTSKYAKCTETITIFCGCVFPDVYFFAYKKKICTSKYVIELYLVCFTLLSQQSFTISRRDIIL